MWVRIPPASPRFIPFSKVLHIFITVNKSDIKLLIEQLLRKELLSESMNVYVKGAPHAERLDNLNGICSHLIDKVLRPVTHEMPSDQQEYFRKNSVGYWEVITPDGSYHSQDNLDGRHGIINVYIAGITSLPLQKILKGIIAELRKLKIKFGKLKKEQSGTLKSEVIRIPILENKSEYTGQPEVNMSNAAAYHIFEKVLQFQAEDEHHSGYSMSVQELQDSIESISQDAGWISQNAKKGFDTHKHKDEWDDVISPEDETNPHLNIVNKSLGAGGARVIFGGFGEDYIKQRLGQLLELCKWAKTHGYKDLYVA